MTEGQVARTGWDVLYHSERLGHSAWANQLPGETTALQGLIRSYQPDVLLDLGTRFGGTTLAFHDAAPAACLLSVDMCSTPETEDLVVLLDGTPGYEDVAYHVRRSWFPSHVRFLQANFVEQHTAIQALIDQARTIGNRFLCYVDGYYKPKEARLYAPWLHSGDLLVVHDCGLEWRYEELAPELAVTFDAQPFPGQRLARAWLKR